MTLIEIEAQKRISEAKKDHLSGILHLHFNDGGMIRIIKEEVIKISQN